MPDYSGYADTPIIAKAYDLLEAYRVRGDVPFFVHEARQCGGDVLEIACGTGRILLPVAEAGVNISGIDISDHMLAVCRGKLEAAPREVRRRARVALKDMREFDLYKSFKLAIIPFNSFLHLTTIDDQVACLRCVHRHLDKGGRLILDLFHPHLPLLLDETRRTKVGEDPPVLLPDGRTVARLRRDPVVDLHSQLITSEAVYSIAHPDGRQETVVHTFLVRYIFRYELEHLLARTGFEIETIYADFYRSPFGSKEPSLMITVARKA